MTTSKTIKILSGAAMRTFLTEIVPLFEQANGAKVEVGYRLTSVLKKEIADGAVFDIALAAAAGDRRIGRSRQDRRQAPPPTWRARPLVSAVRAGAPKPDIATVPAFKAALLAAKYDVL